MLVDLTILYIYKEPVDVSPSSVTRVLWPLPDAKLPQMIRKQGRGEARIVANITIA